jgi:hypothetical protein
MRPTASQRDHADKYLAKSPRNTKASVKLLDLLIDIDKYLASCGVVSDDDLINHLDFMLD